LIADEHEINTMTLDSYLSSSKQLAKRRVALLKMDTQGQEPEVLESLTELLSDFGASRLPDRSSFWWRRELRGRQRGTSPAEQGLPPGVVY